MKTQRRQERTDYGYRCCVSIEFEDLESGTNLDESVEGKVVLKLSDNIPYPVQTGIKDVKDDKSNAAYVEFEKKSQTVESKDRDPIVFQFTTRASRERGSKWYFYKTADWQPESDLKPKEDPEFVKHHLPGIPPAQHIRLIHRILTGEAGEETMYDLMSLYETNREEAASNFSTQIKQYVGFESRVEIQNFLIGRAIGFHRSRSQTANKVAKQIVKEEYRHRVTSLEEVQEMIDLVNQQQNFPEITLKEVFEKVVKRSSEEELMEIANHLGIDDWSVIFLPQ